MLIEMPWLETGVIISNSIAVIILQAEGGDSLLLYFCPCEAPPGELNPGFGPPV